MRTNFAATSGRSCPLTGEPSSWDQGNVPFDSFPLHQNGLHLKDVPVWRDAPSDATDRANVPPPSPGPVWRDSEELLGELNTRGTRDLLFQLPEKQNLRKPAWASSSTSRRSQSPLGTLLRRKRGKPKSSVAVAGGGSKEINATSASSRKKRPAGEAVWKDSPAAPRKTLVDPTRLLDLMSGAEAVPRKTIRTRAFGGSAVVGGAGAVSPLPPPPNEKSPKTNRDWRRIAHPLRAHRNGDQGPKGRSPTCVKVVRPMTHVAESLPGGAAPIRSRDSSSGFLSAASVSSAASFWRSIASIPDGTPARARSPPPVSGGSRLSSQTPLVPPRAPAFEPREGSDRQRTRTNRRSRQRQVPVPVPGDDAQFRHCRGGRIARQPLPLSHDDTQCRYNSGDRGRRDGHRRGQNQRSYRREGRDGDVKQTMPPDVRERELW